MEVKNVMTIKTNVILVTMRIFHDYRTFIFTLIAVISTHIMQIEYDLLSYYNYNQEKFGVFHYFKNKN